MTPHWQSFPLTLSRYAQHLELGGGQHLLTHGILGHPFRVTDAAWEAASLFTEPRTLASAAPSARLPMERLQRLAETLVARRLLVSASEDEDAALRAHFIDETSPDGYRRIHQPAHIGRALPLQSIERLSQSRVPLRVLVLGACFAQGVETLLVEEGLAAGFDLDVCVGTTDALAMADDFRPEVIIYQMPGSIFLRPLLDHFQTLPPEEAVGLLHAFLGYVAHAFTQLEQAARGALVLVHGYYVPQHSPLGALEYRAEVGFFEVLRAANHGILEEAKRRDRFYFVDEDRLFGGFGKRLVQDDALNLYSQHGALDYAERLHGKPADHERSISDSFALPGEALAERLLVEEYLRHFQVHFAPNPIKCVVVDLDGTLWPGAIGDEGFDLGASLPWLTQYRFAGLHQALKILKSRGVLLAIASKNNPQDVQTKWHYPLTGTMPAPDSQEERQVLQGLYKELYRAEGETIYRANERSALMHLHLLRPDDFVTARIGWEPKSAMIRSIAEELNLGLEQVAFIDDSAIERAEVRHHLPDVWVLGDDPNRWRETMLSSARFHTLERTDEATRRTELTRHQLRREAERAQHPDPEAFLRSLAITCEVRQEEDDQALARIYELLARTNQMNLTTRRHDMAALRAFLTDPQAAVYTLSVQDRFTHYGLVGVAIVADGVLDSFVLSCRVMGLGVEHVLMRTVLSAERKRHPERPMKAEFRRTDRNGPCADVLPANGFIESPDEPGHYVLPSHAPVPPLPGHCAVVDQPSARL